MRQLANTFLFQFHDEIRDILGTTKARAMVVKTALEYLDSLSHSAAHDPALTAGLPSCGGRAGQPQLAQSGRLPRRRRQSGARGVSVPDDRIARPG